ncbi:MAG: ABC transporter permease [Candidatus Nanoarchaeia archaeon]
MKWTKTLVKNFKVLMRSRGSALMVLLAPLLIVLIIGLSFAGKTESTLDIGVYLNNNSNDLSQRFLDNLNTSQNSLTIFPSSDSCISAIKEGIVVTCIVFPENFVIADNKTNELIFYVDESRMNLVYQLISSVTLNVGGESGEISKEITQRLLVLVQETKTSVDAGVSSTVSMKAKLKGIEGKSSESKTKISGIDTTVTEVDITENLDTLGDISDAMENLESSAATTLTRGYSLIDDIETEGSNVSTTALATALKNLNTTLNASKTASAEFEDVFEALEQASTELDNLQKKLQAVSTAKTALSANLDKIDADIKSLSTDLDQLKSRLETISNSINAFTYKSADSISSPITTRVESVVAKNNKITYSFPYLLMLVVLFVGIMLASTIVFMEKDSRAFFRNFTTPTRSAHFILMTYFTSLVIIIIQCAIILAAVYFGLQVPLLNNIEVTIALLLLGMSVFILIGMIVGNLFSTSEAITMSTIAIGSVMIFLSNLILPLETLSPLIQQIASYNPYVIVSESIKRAMLMDATFMDLYFQFALLAAYIIGLLIIVISLKKITSSKIFEKLLRRRPKHVFTVPEDHYLKIDEKGLVIRSVPELLDTLKHMSNADYNELVKPKNVFSRWLKEGLNEKKLASSIEKKNLDGAIKVLDKYLKNK